MQVLHHRVFLVELKVWSGVVSDTHVLPSLSSGSVAPRNFGHYSSTIEDVFRHPLLSNMIRILLWTGACQILFELIVQITSPIGHDYIVILLSKNFSGSRSVRHPPITMLINVGTSPSRCFIIITGGDCHPSVATMVLSYVRVILNLPTKLIRITS